MSLPSHEGLLPLHWLCRAALTTSCFPHPCPLRKLLLPPPILPLVAAYFQHSREEAAL